MIGTVVTGSGPHSGDPEAGRTGFDPELVSQLHADVVFLLIGLTVALLVALAATDSPGRVRRAARDLLVVELAQGVVGYVQYFTHVPALLVLLHMAGAVLITVYTARLLWSVRGPASELPVGPRRRSRPPPPAEPRALGPPFRALSPLSYARGDRRSGREQHVPRVQGRRSDEDVGDQGDREQRHVGDRHREQPHRAVGHAAP